MSALALVAGTAALTPSGQVEVMAGTAALTPSGQVEVMADTQEVPYDIRGGGRITYTTSDDGDSGWTYLNVVCMEQTTQGNGISFRARNHTGITTPLSIQLADGKGGMYMPSADGLKYYIYDIFGNNEVEKTYLYVTNIELDPYFDGIIYLPFANYTSEVTTPSLTGAPDFTKLWKISFGLQPLFNGFADYTIGDVFNAGGMNLDTSVLNDEIFSTFFIGENYTTGDIHINQGIMKDFDPTGKDYLGGINIRTYTSDTNKGPVADIVASEQGIFGSGFWMRVKNYGNEVSPMLQVMGCEGDNMLPSDGKPFLYYDKEGNYTATIAANPYNGFVIPANFDGFIYVPLSSLYNGNPGTPVRMDWLYGIFVNVDALAFPNANLIFGDVFNHNNMLTDGSTTTHASFASQRHVSNETGKIYHYPGFSGELATAWAEMFLEATYPCDTAASQVWEDMKAEYDVLSQDDKNLLIEAVYLGKAEEDKNLVEQAMERFDLAVLRQGLENFTSRTIQSFNSIIIDNQVNDRVVVIVCLVITLSLMVTGVVFFISKKRKKLND